MIHYKAMHEEYHPYTSFFLCRVTISIKICAFLYKLNKCIYILIFKQTNLRFSILTFLKTDINEMCEGDKKDFNIYYKDILEAQNDDSILIIDVREQSEIDETGKLPGSIHIPMGDVSNVFLNFSEKTFKERFDKEKPSKETKIILSCRSGKRSGMVQEEIQRLGYKNAYNYIGGWLDWESNQKV
ncbi:rhodanese domain-containing protein CG4456 isoform X2 [Ptiloglossa arizonensis]|uniref:rhodanese domain-containing protein CG4456 isoform X2 n=1 Tax=Ptiloglossa arizonensis TaxID=3350558 RepID=UPI003FA15715